jgi:hypothetical protein
MFQKVKSGDVYHVLGRIYCLSNDIDSSIDIIEQGSTFVIVAPRQTTHNGLCHTIIANGHGMLNLSAATFPTPAIIRVAP